MSLQNGKVLKYFQLDPRLLGPCLLVATTLACVTNTPVAQISTPRPTRTPFPTFTITPIPPSPTPVPTRTNTPIPSDTPIPTHTPLPPTDTPIPTDTLVPTAPPPPPPTNPPAPAAPPPTAAPVPAAPAPANTSPIAAPTNTPEPGTPPGQYEVRGTQQKNDCANIGVFGKVREKGSDRPVQFATIEVKGDDSDYQGPYIDKTNQDGRYDIFISGLKEDIDGVKFKAKVVGAGVESEDTVEWEISTDCHGDDAIQVYEINWDKK